MDGGNRDNAANEDQRLVAAVLARTPGGFEQLVERHQKLVWHLVYRMVRHPEDTRELSQEVFLRVYRQLHQFRFESALGTWIGRIAFSVAARHLQRRRLPLAEPVDDDIDLPEQIADDFDLEAAFADADLLARLGEALETLPPLQRTLLTLYHLDELGIARIAEITDMPQGTVKNYLFRARVKLRERFTILLGESG